MAFVRRTSKPVSTNLYYISTSKGGYNKCIVINKSTGWVLPNCVGYAWGRVMEILGEVPKLATNNAEDWWAHTSDGYKRDQTATEGAVMCWRKGAAGNQSDGAGHVAVVEKVNSDGSVIATASNYGGTEWYQSTYSKSYSLGGTYVFQGFIHPVPANDPIKIIGTPDMRNPKIKQVQVDIPNLRVRRNPTLSGTIDGYIAPGVYDILDTMDYTGEASNGHVWYRTSVGWIAADVDGVITLPVDPADPDDQATIAELREQLEAMTAERDEAVTEAAGYYNILIRIKEDLKDFKPYGEK